MDFCSSVRTEYKGDGVTTLFSFSFTYFDEEDLQVFLYDFTTKKWVLTTEWTLANATEVEFDSAPPVPEKPELNNIRIERITQVEPGRATFYPGSSIRAQDLNDNFDQVRYAIQETKCTLDEVKGIEDLIIDSIAIKAVNATFAEAFDGSLTNFTLSDTVFSSFNLSITINGILQQPEVDYIWDADDNQVIFTTAPLPGSDYAVTIRNFVPSEVDPDSNLFVQNTAQVPLAIQPEAYIEDPEILERLDKARENAPRKTLMQSDLNEEVFYGFANTKRKASRDRNQVRFIQNAIVEGQWQYDAAIVNNELPEPGSFNMYKEDGTPTNSYAEVFQITFSGLDSSNVNALSNVRKGATMSISDVIVNSVGQFIITNVEFIGNPLGGQFWATFQVVLKYGRNVGNIPDDVICEVNVTSPYPCISSEGEPPFADEDGYLWYNETNKTLYVSDWEDGQNNNGDAVWIPVGGEGVEAGGGKVHVGDSEPDEYEEGSLWFDTTRLELYVYYVEGEDGGWLPTSPLGARVTAGEQLQEEILQRVVNGEDQQRILQAKVNALEGQVGSYEFIFTSSNSNVRSGEFNLKNNGLQLVTSIDDGTAISLSNEDRFGKEVDFTAIKVNDVIRISDIAFETADLKVLEANETGYYKYEKVGGTMNRLTELPYSFQVLSSFDPTGLATIDYVDAQVENKMETNTFNQVTTDFRIKSNDKNLISTAGGTLGLYNLKSPTNDDHAVPRGYADGRYFKKSGDTLVGELKFQRTDDSSYWSYIRAMKPNAWNTAEASHGLILDIGQTNSFKQQFKVIGRSSRELFKLYDDGGANAKLSGDLNVTGQLKENGKRVATQEYVDEHVGEGGGGFAVARSGTDDNPTLTTGELYLNTTSKTLFIGM